MCFFLLLYFPETTFIHMPPSLLASACICAAARGINSPSAVFALRDVCLLTQADPFEIEFTVRHIEQVVSKETAALQKQQQQQFYGKNGYNSNNGKLATTCSQDAQTTPTDIQDVYF
jgi:hypothetical protein